MVYWCETCGGINFKTEGQLRKHLKEKHGIITYKNNQVSGLGYDFFECPFCGKVWKFSSSERTGEIYSFPKPMSIFAKNHLRKHLKFLCDGKQFRTLISLLHYIDEKHGVHVGYVKGMIKKRVFLDGITRTKRK